MYDFKVSTYLISLEWFVRFSISFFKSVPHLILNTLCQQFLFSFRFVWLVWLVYSVDRMYLELNEEHF